MNGAFNFNRMPLAPPGTWIIVHEKPKVRKPGQHMVWMAGMLDQHHNTIDATVATSQKQIETE
eukprot:11186237-Ditylum_brightwellii.AAC.1